MTMRIVGRPGRTARRVSTVRSRGRDVEGASRPSSTDHRTVPGDAASADPTRRRDGGFALLAVLWVMVGVAAIALAASLAGRQSVAAARNRGDLTRAAWRAEGCAEAARAAASAALREDRRATGGSWRTLDAVLASAPITAGCDLRVRPAGAALDANAADGETLLRLLAALGVGPARADSLADALLDWRDADAVPRPRGAEGEWYRAAGAFPPRDGPLADPRELLRVRGWDAVPRALDVLDVEPGRVSLDHAAPAVLVALPGMTPESAARVEEARARGRRPATLSALQAGLAPSALQAMTARWADLSRAATLEPDAWIVEARAAEGAPPAVAVVELRLARAGRRAAVVRRRTWVE